jgi:predicted KAP-like P-loop ATPase
MKDIEEVLEGIWRDDLMGRRNHAESLYAFLQGQINRRKSAKIPNGYVLNVDAAWGAGKTFFLRRFASHLRAQNHIVIEINAWLDDNSTDPFVRLLSSFESVLEPFRSYI